MLGDYELENDIGSGEPEEGLEAPTARGWSRRGNWIPSSTPTPHSRKPSFPRHFGLSLRPSENEVVDAMWFDEFADPDKLDLGVECRRGEAK